MGIGGSPSAVQRGLVDGEAFFLLLKRMDWQIVCLKSCCFSPVPFNNMATNIFSVVGTDYTWHAGEKEPSKLNPANSKMST